jgi:L-threonylcarbamoyladenylate synthase
VSHAGRPRVVAVDSLTPAPVYLRAAADILRAGGLVAFPTETFYGLAAAALDPTPVKRIFELKGRPDSKPLLVLVDSVAMAERIAYVGTPARTLMARYWPGALTLVLPARAVVPADVTAATGTVGLRLSSHPIAQGLVSALGEPVTAPSANPTDLEPPTTAGAVVTYFAQGLDLVLDGGSTPGGQPSTVLDVTTDRPTVIRQGAVLVREAET